MPRLAGGYRLSGTQRVRHRPRSGRHPRSLLSQCVSFRASARNENDLAELLASLEPLVRRTGLR